MSFRSNISRWPAVFQFLLRRGVIIALVLVAVIFILLSGRDRQSFIWMRSITGSLSSPLYAIINWPIDSLSNLASDFNSFRRLRVEHQQLLQDVRRLEQWQEVARKLEIENKALRELLNFVPEPNSRALTARVVSDTGGLFVRNLLVAAGASSGVIKGQIAMTGAGLVGRVTEVGQSSSRILLLTDLNSRIPVAIENSKERAIVAGDNSPKLWLRFLAQDSKVAVGDRIVTSGQGGGFPPGLPIGQVVDVSDGEVSVRSYANITHVELVELVDYGLNDYLPTPTSPIPPRGTKR